MKERQAWLNCQPREENTHLVEGSLFCACETCAHSEPAGCPGVWASQAARGTQENPQPSTGNPLGSATAQRPQLGSSLARRGFRVEPADAGMGRSPAWPALLGLGRERHCSNPGLTSRLNLPREHRMRGNRRCWPGNGPNNHLWGLMLGGPNR